MATVQEPIRIIRPSTSVSWGFRLQGGSEVGIPLSIQRVFVGSPSEGHLNRGDEIVAIDNQGVQGFSNMEAEEKIKRSGLELLLLVKRTQVHHSPLVETQLVSYPFEMGGLEEYDHARDLHLIKQKFDIQPQEDQPRGKVQINARPGSTSYVPRKVTISSGQGFQEFGWTPQQKSHEDLQARYRSHHNNPLNQQVLKESTYSVSSYNIPPQSLHENYEKPAWLGTLRSASGLKLWESDQKTPSFFSPDSSISQNDKEALKSIHNPNVQNFTWTPSGVKYSQKSSCQKDTSLPSPSSSFSPQIQHSQYNSPLKLYSATNAKEVLSLQTSNKPGAGTLKILEDQSINSPSSVYNPFQSEVFKLVKEEGDMRRRKRRENHPSFSKQVANGYSDF